jgi:hypothetical protein
MKPQNDKPSKDSGAKPGPYGEGNYEATRQYNKGVKEHMDKHDIEKEARDAAPKSDAEAKEMLDAEREAASRSKAESPNVRKAKSPK